MGVSVVGGPGSWGDPGKVRVTLSNLCPKVDSCTPRSQDNLLAVWLPDKHCWFAEDSEVGGC